MTTRRWSRRRILKTAAASAAGGVMAGRFSGVLAARPTPWESAALADGSAAPDQSSPGTAAAGRERLLADFGWTFALGHANDPSKDFGFGRGGIFAKSGSFIGGGRNGIANPAYDDSAWTHVDLPHDWAIDLPFVDDRSLDSHGYKPLGRNYPETSIGWYRRTFDIPAADAGRRISLQFDGIYRDATIILNGHYLGRHMSGYTPARYDVTDFLNYGAPNVLIVRVDCTENEGWFYEGAGIYRHVWLEKTAPLHVAHDGVFVTSTVNADGSATVQVETTIVNAQDRAVSARLRHVIQCDCADSMLAVSPVALAARETKTIRQSLIVRNARVWAPDHPAMYELVTELSGGRHVDRVPTSFGIRTIHFDAEKGFFINGTPLKIQGTCNHHDHAGVGAALPDRLNYFRVERLKEMGCNAYRTSHNPPTPELLDACDRLGLLVLDETRMMDASAEGLAQLETLVRRDRNHPSVFMWSIGNEEPEQNTDRGARIGASMIRLVKRLDPTRPVTEANNGSGGWGRGLGPLLDVFGFNYSLGATDAFHQKFPKQPTVGTEFASTVSTRGEYDNDPVKGYVSSYDANFPPWASTAETWWTHVAARPWLSGGFVWTGFDYRGEPTPYQWPCINSHFGIMDMCGFPKDLFFYYRAWWTNEPVLHLFPHWKWPGKEGQLVDVWCFTNCDTVELFVNGITAGWQKVQTNSHCSWRVPYHPGAIEVRGTRPHATGTAGAPMVTRIETTGAAYRLTLQTDRSSIMSNGEDVAIVTATVTDAEGRVVPDAAHQVTFDVDGEGRVLGVGNGDPSSHEADRTNTRRAFHGMCMAIVQSTKKPGVVAVRATAPGLFADARLTIQTTGAPRAAV